MPGRIYLRFLGTASQPNISRNYSSILLKTENHSALM